MADRAAARPAATAPAILQGHVPRRTGRLLASPFEIPAGGARSHMDCETSLRTMTAQAIRVAEPFGAGRRLPTSSCAKAADQETCDRPRSWLARAFHQQSGRTFRSSPA